MPRQYIKPCSCEQARVLGRNQDRAVVLQGKTAVIGNLHTVGHSPVVQITRKVDIDVFDEERTSMKRADGDCAPIVLDLLPEEFGDSGDG